MGSPPWGQDGDTTVGHWDGDRDTAIGMETPQKGHQGMGTLPWGHHAVDNCKEDRMGTPRWGWGHHGGDTMGGGQGHRDGDTMMGTG